MLISLSFRIVSSKSLSFSVLPAGLLGGPLWYRYWEEGLPSIGLGIGLNGGDVKGLEPGGGVFLELKPDLALNNQIFNWFLKIIASITRIIKIIRRIINNQLIGLAVLVAQHSCPNWHDFEYVIFSSSFEEQEKIIKILRKFEYEFLELTEYKRQLRKIIKEVFEENTSHKITIMSMAKEIQQLKEENENLKQNIII